MNFETADSQGRAEGIIRLGTIAEVDNANRKVRVQSAELLSGWLPYPTAMGNNFIAWTPMRIGQQVVVGCPSGDFAQGLILQTLYTDSLNSPSIDAGTDMIQFNDGTVIKKDAGGITISTPGNIDINAGGNITMTAAKIDLN